MNDVLISFGSAVKAMGGGKIAGHLIVFGDPAQPDQTSLRDYFDGQTDFAVDEWPIKSAIYYHHGLDPDLGKRRLGVGSLKMTDLGVWIDAQLDLRDEWEQAVYSLVEAGKLSWSSGTARHLTERDAIKAGGKVIAHHITHWPLGLDASLTPIPGEMRCDAVALKSLDVPTLATLRTGKAPVKASAIKAELLGDVEFPMTLAAVDSATCCLTGRLWSALYEAMDTESTLDYVELGAMFDEYKDIVLRVIQAIMAADAEEDRADVKARALQRPFSAEEVASLQESGRKIRLASLKSAEGSRSLAERTEQMLDDLGDLLVGYRQVKTAEMKVGRKLSASRRERLTQAQELIADLLSETAVRDEPAADTDEAPGMGAAEDTQKALALLKLKSRAVLALSGR